MTEEKDGVFVLCCAMNCDVKYGCSCDTAGIDDYSQECVYCVDGIPADAISHKLCRNKQISFQIL